MLIQGDARNIPLADKSVQMVCTSPPYWGLRDYGVASQIGLERTPEAYVETMVDVFREVRRVLRDDGALWLNLGDSYAGHNQPGWRKGNEEKNGGASNKNGVGYVSGLKPKDLLGIPWRVAFALQADGWYLRSDIIWAKPNPMPESVTDRPTRSHEYLFLLTKSERYFYDAEAIRERIDDPIRYAKTFRHGKYVNNCTFDNGHIGPGEGIYGESKIVGIGRNKRDVWTINSEPTPEAHFATFPQKLVEPCILAGTSEKGCCAECSAPRVRVTEIESRGTLRHEPPRFGLNGVSGSGVTQRLGTPRIQTTGWPPSCSHDAPSVPCLVLDPFAGSGTVEAVCNRFGRRAISLELSADYIEIAKKRTSQMGLFANPA